ncbi:MAG TPA: VOC family protein [Patescibacteria group bacterium]|nr:VOC family protein [Patescibacteria group bacterium]
MAQVVGIDHLTIRVSDLAASKEFYNKVLGFLGFTLEWEFDSIAGWNNGLTMFWIGEADEKGKKHPHRVGNIGFHHYAFELGARGDVDELYGFLVSEGVKIVDPPADYPDYGEGYYAVFFLDPDGLKLEGMYFLEKVKKLAARSGGVRR